MIKCFIVESNEGIDNMHGFKPGCKYLAKLSNTGSNTIAILDESLNWRPYDYARMCMRINQPYDRYFKILSTMLSPNKKSLRIFVDNCKEYGYTENINLLWDTVIETHRIERGDPLK